MAALALGLDVGSACRPGRGRSKVGRRGVPPEREGCEMKGKGSSKSKSGAAASSPTMSGLAQRLGPLRRSIEVLRHADDAFGTSRVRFECAHKRSVSSGAIYKGRCRRCRQLAALPSPG